jgi:autotransporter-associated beta strand protein
LLVENFAYGEPSMLFKPVFIKREIRIYRLPGLLSFLAAAILLTSASTTKAVTMSWNAVSGDWSTSDNWLPLPGAEPTLYDNVYIQNGGTANISQVGEACASLYMGASGAKNSGAALMSGGSCYVWGMLYIGDSGTGTFTQTGGTNSINLSLTLGSNSGSSGTYILSDTGQLSANSLEIIGGNGTGTFTQTGGTNNASIVVGSNGGSSGTYNLSGTGQLYADTEKIGDNGTGTFTQTGGTNTITHNLYLGFNFGSGTYDLSGTGQLSANAEYIGYIGTGTFTQTGGTNTTSSLVLGALYGPRGTYNLNGGTLNLGSLNTTGGPGTPQFNFGGGTLKPSTPFFSTTMPMTLTGDGGNANIDSAGYSVTLSGLLSGTGGLNKLGSGTLTLSASNSFTGPVGFNGGFIRASALNCLGNGSLLTFNGGGLQFAGTFDPSIRTMTFLAGGATLDTGTSNTILANPIGNSGVGGLTMLGSGKLTLNALSTYSGDTTVSGRILEIAGGIAASGTSLIDVHQSGTAILKTVNVSKINLNIHTAALATFEVVNGSHVIGAISGSGITKIDAGASLTAASINQGTLTIGSGATVTIQAIPGGPQSGPITSVPEPSALLLLAGALFLAMFAWARKGK